LDSGDSFNVLIPKKGDQNQLEFGLFLCKLHKTSKIICCQVDETDF